MPYAQYTVKGGDNIRLLSQRLLGDFNRWQELVTINELDPPFIVDNRGDYLGLKVLEPSDTLYYPRGDESRESQEARLYPYGRDINMDNEGYLVFQRGALALTSDIRNLQQALTRRLGTVLGNLPAHPDTYGHVMNDYIGNVRDAAMLETILLEARRCITADSRIASVQAGAVADENGLTKIDAYCTTQEQSLGVLDVTQTVRL